jgi:hypothetical protein
MAENMKSADTNSTKRTNGMNPFKDFVRAIRGIRVILGQ